MKFLIAVFFPASSFINFRDLCQNPRLLHPPRLLFWPKLSSLPVYSTLPFYLKLESSPNDWCDVHNIQDSLHVHELRLGSRMNSTCWREAWSFLGENVSFFRCPWRFHWRNTFHTIAGVQLRGQIKDNNFSRSQFSFLSKPRFLFSATGLILPRYFSITINRSIVTGFVIKNICIPHIKMKGFAAVFNHRSSEFPILLLLKWHVCLLFLKSLSRVARGTSACVAKPTSSASCSWW